MKQFFVVLFVCASTFLSAQTKFEKGYYINLNGIKSDGFIKNSDWKNSPNSIEFKTNITDNAIEVNASQISEFEIENKLKFKRFNVNIERSSVSPGQLSINSKTPIFKKEDLLLKVLIDGKASLYYYFDNGITKFFYATDKKEIEQLLFLSYIADKADVENLKAQGIDDVIQYASILYDRTYRKQLNENVNCESTREQLNKLEYSKTALLNFFKKYNECNRSEFKKFDSGSKSTFRLKASIISNFSGVDLNRLSSEVYSADFGNSVSFGFGFEAELVLPFNNNKWAVITEPSYNSYSDSETLYNQWSLAVKNQKVEVKYTYIQVPIGVRHYFYLNNNSSIFINALYNAKFKIGDNNAVRYSYTTAANAGLFPSLNNLAFGIGFNYKKYSIESRFFSNTQLLARGDQNNQADYKNISVNLRYQLL